MKGVARERDLTPVWRPRKPPLAIACPGTMREVSLAAAIAVHDVDFVVAVAVADKGDSAPVRRPVRALIVTRVPGQVAKTAPIGSDNEDLEVEPCRWACVDIKRERSSVRSPDNLTNPIASPGDATTITILDGCHPCCAMMARPERTGAVKPRIRDQPNQRPTRSP